MKRNSFLSREFLFLGVSLIVSVFIVAAVYTRYIGPTARNIEIASLVDEQQNPDAISKVNRSLVVILKDPEQMLCLMLMGWALQIIAYKSIRLLAERNVSRRPFLGISKGERIIPEEALGYYRELKTDVTRQPGLRGKILPELILSALHRFDSTRSIQDASIAVNDRAELAFDEMDSDMSLLRYISWAIPSVGFIGTVRGIGEALALAPEAIRGDVTGVTGALGVAFNSTLVALVLSIVLMFLLHILQAKMEKLLIDFRDFANKRVIALMKTPERQETQISFT